jgi:septal ring factor EnvC (AmiA/AmiB activator)
MHTDAIINADEQRTQIGADPLDYVLRYAACDYDCYYRGRYIGSRPTLPKAIEAVEYVQAKAARHPQPSSAANATIAAYQDELRAIAARLHDLANRLASHPTEQAPLHAQLTMAHIRVSTALRSIQDAERSLALAGQMTDVVAPLDAAA